MKFTTKKLGLVRVSPTPLAATIDEYQAPMLDGGIREKQYQLEVTYAVTFYATDAMLEEKKKRAIKTCLYEMHKDVLSDVHELILAAPNEEMYVAAVKIKEKLLGNEQ